MAAMIGIVCGGLIGSPIATMLIERGRVALPCGRAGTVAAEPATKSSRRRSPSRRAPRRRARTSKPTCC